MHMPYIAGYPSFNQILFKFKSYGLPQGEEFNKVAAVAPKLYNCVCLHEYNMYCNCMYVHNNTCSYIA